MFRTLEVKIIQSKRWRSPSTHHARLLTRHAHARIKCLPIRNLLYPTPSITFWPSENISNPPAETYLAYKPAEILGGGCVTRGCLIQQMLESPSLILERVWNKSFFGANLSKFNIFWLFLIAWNAMDKVTPIIICLKFLPISSVAFIMSSSSFTLTSHFSSFSTIFKTLIWL